MRKLALVLLFCPVLSTPSFAQSADADSSCKAPVALSDKDCSDALATATSRDRQGTMEQRDDGYYVFVPRQGD